MPIPLYPFVEFPEDVKMILPLVSRSDGSAALTFFDYQKKI
jgi:hypothetical protein